MSTPSEFIVGIDGSPGSERALAWAANEAARRQAGLLVLTAYDWRGVGTPPLLGEPVAPDVRAHAEHVATDTRVRAEQLVARAVATVRESIPHVAVRGQAVLGHAAQTLIRASGGAATIVVGSRGRGGFASLLLGSVSQQVALHARGPVVVVRGRSDPEGGPVLVGVDGSPESEQALRLAFEEARIRGTGVTAVRAYTPLPPAYPLALPSYLEDPVQRQQDEQAALAADVAPWAEKYPYVHVSCTAVEGHPADVLTRRSQTASLVVVGNRGRGGFAGLLLGSVGLHLLHHADCPVLIARTSPA